MNSLQGHLLLASPELRDPNFYQTVVLIVRHDEEGAFGLVLNRPTSMGIAEVWRQVSDTPFETPDPVYLGGPVHGPLMALHTQPEYAEIEVLPNLCYSVQSDQLEQLVAQYQGDIKFFLGFAGWGRGQLEMELGEGAWLSPKATSEQIFETDHTLWKRLIQQHHSPLLSALGIKHIPPDPSMN